MFPPVFALWSGIILLCVSMGHFATVHEHSMSNPNPLTSHVLDTAKGRPVEGLLTKLSKKGSNGTWIPIAEKRTNSDGRVGDLISETEFTAAVYKLYFDTKSYFTVNGEKTFYPFIEIIFEIHNPNEHYHVPILLSAYGYSTYRGS